MRPRTLQIPFYELINPTFYLLSAPVVITTSVVANADLADYESVFIWLTANLLGLGASLGSVWAIRRLVPNHLGFLVGPAGWVITGYLIGALKSFLTFTAVTAFGETTWDAGFILTRTATAGLLGVPIFLTAGLALYFLNAYKQQRDELFQQSVILDIESEFYDTGLEEIRQNLEAIESALKQDSLDANRLASQLRELAERSVRPLSHKIWQQASKKVKDYSLGELLRAGIASRPFSPLGFAAASFLGLVQWSLIHQSGWNALGLILMTIAPGIVLSQIGNFIRVRSKYGQIIRYVAIYGLSALSAMLAAQVINGASLVNDLSLLIALTVWFLEFGLVIALTKGGLAAQEDLDSTIRLVFGERNFSRVAADASKRLRARSIAQNLHSDVQNRLLGTAMHVEAGVLDSVAAKSEIAKLRDRILSISVTSERRPTIGAALQSLKDQWHGFLEIESQCEEQLKKRSISNELSQVLSETVLNARRHGLARRLSIRIVQTSESTIELTAINDGLGPQGKDSGLGHELFETLTNGKWSLTQNQPSGAKLELNLLVSKLHL